jgi:hypothetical protein
VKLPGLVPSVHAGWNASGRPLAFVAGDCGPCPARGLRTTGKRRQLTLMPRALAEAQAAARAAEATIPFRADCARRGTAATMGPSAAIERSVASTWAPRPGAGNRSTCHRLAAAR